MIDLKRIMFCMLVVVSSNVATLVSMEADAATYAETEEEIFPVDEDKNLEVVIDSIYHPVVDVEFDDNDTSWQRADCSRGSCLRGTVAVTGSTGAAVGVIYLTTIYISNTVTSLIVGPSLGVGVALAGMGAYAWLESYLEKSEARKNRAAMNFVIESSEDALSNV